MNSSACKMARIARQAACLTPLPAQVNEKLKSFDEDTVSRCARAQSLAALFFWRTDVAGARRLHRLPLCCAGVLTSLALAACSVGGLGSGNTSLYGDASAQTAQGAPA